MRFITTTEPLKIYFGPGGQTFRIGIDMGSAGGTSLIAFHAPWLEEGALMFGDVEGGHCHVYSTGDHAADLRTAQDELASSQGSVPEMPVLPGHAFVVIHGRRAQFEVSIDSNHASVRGESPGTEKDLRFTTQQMDLGSMATIAHWEEGPEISVVLDVRGVPGIFPAAFSMDLGTTNTCAAFMGGDPPEPRLVRYENEKQASIPTVLLYDEIPETGARRYIIGDRAQREVEGDQRRFVRMFKRHLDADEAFRSLEVADQRGTRHKLRVDDVYLDFLKAFLGDFEARRHVLVRRVKATYPPDFRPRALQDMKRAYSRMKADTRSLLGIDEASAAALYYVFHNLQRMNFDIDLYQAHFRKEHNMLVFDFGGGTTDVSLVSVGVGSSERDGDIRHGIHFKVLGAASHLHLGGDNLTLELLRSIRCRIALAAAEHHKGRGDLIEFNSEDAADAMEELYRRRQEFKDLLELRGVDWAQKAQMLAELERLASAVLPTAWRQVSHDQDIFLRERAMNTFNLLWNVAEEWKKKLSAETQVSLDRTGFLEDYLNEAFRNLDLVDTDVIDTIELDQENDLYGRIRGMVAEGLQLCRQVMRKPHGAMHRVDSIRLVGNSCRMPLVKELLLEELKDIPRVEEIVSFDQEYAKASVALGACLAAHINDFGEIRHIDVTFEGVDDQLGWEIGEWENFTKTFDVHFHPDQRPADRPYVDIEDSGRERLVLWRRRPGHEDPPEMLGKFVLSRQPEPNSELEPAPSGKLRLYLIDRVTMRLLRGQSLYRIGWPKQQVTPERDPFSGVH